MNAMIKYTLIGLSMLGIILISMAGCQQEQIERSKQYVVNTATIANALIELDHQFERTELTITHLQESLDTNDFRDLTLAAQELKQLRHKIHETVQASGGLPRFLINAEQIKTLYLKGGDSYARARAIIEKYWDGLPSDTQLQLKTFDRQVSYLHLAMIQLQAMPEGSDISQTVQEIISIGAAAAKVLVITGVL